MAWLAADKCLREGKLFRDIGLGALASTIFAIAPPFMFMIVIDRVLVNNSYPTLNVLVGAILIMMVTETILGHVRPYSDASGVDSNRRPIESVHRREVAQTSAEFFRNRIPPAAR